MKRFKRYAAFLLINIALISSFSLSVLAAQIPDDQENDSDVITVEVEKVEEETSGYEDIEPLRDSENGMDIEFSDPEDDLSGEMPSVEIYSSCGEENISVEEESTGPEEQEEPVYLTEGPTEEDFFPEGRGEDSSELLDLYADQKLKEQLRRSGGMLRAPRSNASKLKGMNIPVYAEVYRRISLVAAGEENSTEFTLDFSELGIEKTGWTADELGVSSLTSVVDGRTVISPDAKSAVNEQLLLDIPLVIKTLLADCPYELYWYDKTQSTKYTGYGFSLRGNVLSITGPLSIRFPVAMEYAVSDYTLNTSYGAGITSAVQTASDIVSSHSAKSDYDKLAAYRDEICERVSYNYAVAEENTAYGNPWQIIWVFDDDSATNVVCEGYSKSFQYLCDLSSFQNNIRVCSVTGTINGGDHMWNLVTMEDGKNYLTDITNCDTGAAGYPDRLFLTGASDGDVDTYYILKVPSAGIVTYTYDDDAREVFSETELTLSLNPYVSGNEEAADPCGEGHDYHLDGWMWASDYSSAAAFFVCSRDDRHTVLINALIETAFDPAAGGDVLYAVLGSGESPDHEQHMDHVVRPVTGWYRSGDGKSYYFSDDHAAVTGWNFIDGDYYFFNSDGEMQAGWVKISGKWYYLDGSGAMVTGWKYLSGKWYYLDGSGAMVTGWKYLSGKWYYLDSSGAMATGWKYLSGKWYYLNASGVMQTGRQKINGMWYSFSANGAMQ